MGNWGGEGRGGASKFGPVRQGRGGELVMGEGGLAQKEIISRSTPCVPKSSTRPPLSPLRKHLRHFSEITIHTNVFKF